MDSSLRALDPGDLLEHTERLRRLVRALVRDPERAADVVQETWLAALRGGPGRGGEGGRRAWLTAVAARLAARDRRARARAEQRERAAARPEVDPASPQPDALARAELLRAVADAVLALEEPYRTAVALRYLEGRAPREIARLTGCSNEAARQRISRGLAMLRARLDERKGGRSTWALAAVRLTAPRVLIGGAITGGLGMTSGWKLAAAGATALLLAAAGWKALGSASTPSDAAEGDRRAGAELGPQPQVAHVPPRAGEPPPPEDERQAVPVRAPPIEDLVELRAVDADTGAGLAGAELEVRLLAGSVERVVPLTTGEGGAAAVPAPSGELASLRVLVQRPGYAPSAAIWSSEDGRRPLPRSFEIPLLPARPIGGVVVDESGGTVEGAVVHVPRWTWHRDEWARFVRWELSARTDAAGRWRMEEAPGHPQRVQLRIVHPGFVAELSYDDADDPPYEALARFEGTSVLRSGIEVTGRVIDDKGLAVAGAEVLFATWRLAQMSGHPRGIVVTDPSGGFALHADPGRHPLAVRARGFGPRVQTIEVRAGVEPLVLRLERAAPVFGRVVDAEGSPLEEASVVLARGPFPSLLDLELVTDVEGRFRWEDAPLQPIRFDVMKLGFMSVRKRVLHPHVENEVVLPPELVFRGRVTDARNGEPIPEFRAVEGYHFAESPEHLNWDESQPHPGRDGSYELESTYPRLDHAVRIEADGYRSAVSPFVPPTAGTVVFDAALQPAADISGVVLSPAGDPVEGADVALSLPETGPEVRRGRLDNYSHVLKTVTDADGRFAFAPRDGPFAVFAVAAEGFTRLDGARFEGGTESELRLEPWGALEGISLSASAGGSAERVALEFDAYSLGKTTFAPGLLVELDWSAETDEQGRFSFDRVPPGSGTLRRTWIDAQGIRTGFPQPAVIPFRVVAGQTAEIVLP